jgi:hypothetical protein
MIDEVSDWIPHPAAVDLVETTLQCYREKAVDLVRQAVTNLKVKSRSVNSPMWLVSDMAGNEVIHGGKSIEVCRNDVVEFCLELQRAATRSSPRETKSALRRNIVAAIKEIPVDAPFRNKKIHELLISRRIIGKDQDVTRTIQRVLKTM